MPRGGPIKKLYVQLKRLVPPLWGPRAISTPCIFCFRHVCSLVDKPLVFSVGCALWVSNWLDWSRPFKVYSYIYTPLGCSPWLADAGLWAATPRTCGYTGTSRDSLREKSQSPQWMVYMPSHRCSDFDASFTPLVSGYLIWGIWACKEWHRTSPMVRFCRQQPWIEDRSNDR